MKLAGISDTQRFGNGLLLTVQGTLSCNDKTLEVEKVTKQASQEIPFIEMHTGQFMMLK